MTGRGNGSNWRICPQCHCVNHICDCPGNKLDADEIKPPGLFITLSETVRHFCMKFFKQNNFSVHEFETKPAKLSMNILCHFNNIKNCTETKEKPG
jgi:hypothetical protein